MKNYSYHIVGLIDNSEEIGGTGFFIKNGSGFFFVSAWHCFSFKNHITRKHENPKAHLINNIVIYRNIADIKSNDFLRTILINPKTDLPNYLSIYHDRTLLDISAIEIDRESSFDFDYIEIDNQLINSIPSINDRVHYNGFPIVEGKQNDLSEYYEGSITDMNTSINEITLEIVSYTGCSGAPLFVKIDNLSMFYGVLYYALKDSTGKAENCRAISIEYLINELV